MRVMALVIAGALAATAAAAQEPTAQAPTTDGPAAGAAASPVPALPGSGEARPGDTPPALPSLPPAGARGAAAQGGSRAALVAGQPVVNPRQQELERRSREIDRRVMRSICSGC